MSRTVQGAHVPPMYFTTVIAIDRGFAIVGGHLYVEGATPSRTIFLRIEASGWKKYLTIEQIVYSTTKCLGDQFRPLTISLLARDGQYVANPKGRGVSRQQIPVNSSGYLLSVAGVREDVLACGDMYQVFRRHNGAWAAEVKGLPIPRLFDETCTLKAIDGFAPDDLYAVGSSGQIWHLNGSRWQQLDQVTSLT